MPIPFRFLSLAAVLTAVAVAFGCGGGGGGGGDGGVETAGIDGPRSCDAREGGSITVAFNEELPTFDPSENPVVGPTAFTVTPLVFDRLLQATADLEEFEPQLATSVEANDDFTEWTIEVREGVTFHDGSKLDSEDVAFSLQYNFDGFNGYALGPVAEIEAVDPRTVRITMEEPYARLESQGLASWLTGFVYPADLNGQKPADFFSGPVGTGPYSVAEYRPGQGIDFAANGDYWGDGPYIDSIEARFIADSNERLLGLESGDFAFVDRLAGDQVDNLPEGTVARVIEPSAVTDVINTSSRIDLLTDDRVREAISLALNRPEIADGAYAGYADVPEATLPLALPNVEPLADNPYVYDLERAQQLMTESSFPDGGELELTYIRGDPNTELEAQLVQDDLAAIGIDVTFAPVSANEYFDLAVEGTRDSTLFNNSAISPDPIDFVGFYADSGGYYGDWPTKPVDEIIGGLNRTDDPGELQALYTGYEEYIAGINTQIPIVSPRFLNANADELSNLAIDPLNEVRFGQAWLCEG